MKNQKERKNKLPLYAKIPIIILSSIVGLFVLVWGGVNILKFAIYADYYGRMTNLGSTPGLNDGFVPQGICVNEENNIYLMSGYVPKNPSQIYITGGNDNKDFVTKKFDLYQGDKAFKAHVGGIANSGNNVFLATNGKIFVLDLDYLLTTNETKIDVGNGISVNSSSSFVFSNDEYLYVGEFHDGVSYITNHPYQTNDGEYNAIVEKFLISDFLSLSKAAPLEVYSIRNNVQGFAINESGDIYLSTSFGLTSSIYYKYPASSLTKTDLEFEGAPVSYLDGEFVTLTGPAMSEDLDYSEGKLICYTESACNKYIFGKFFFAYYFFSLNF